MKLTDDIKPTKQKIASKELDIRVLVYSASVRNVPRVHMVAFMQASLICMMVYTLIH
jgi:hypothetical protein